MTISEFDIKAAKLQVKLLQELGEPVPHDVQALADFSPDMNRDTPSPALNADGREKRSGSGFVSDFPLKKVMDKVKEQAYESPAEALAVLAIHRPFEDRIFYFDVADAEAFVRQGTLVLKFEDPVTSERVMEAWGPSSDTGNDESDGSSQGKSSIRADDATDFKPWGSSAAQDSGDPSRKINPYA